MTRKTLMIPGPSETDSEILCALSRPALPHYGEEWRTIYERITESLQRIFQTENGVIVVPSPGMACVEMAAASLLEPGEKAIVPVNGYFAAEAESIIRSYGAKTIRIPVAYGKAVDPEVLREVFENHDEIKALFVVHSETSTGAANSLEPLCKVAKSHGALTFVDAVSSFGGMNLEVDKWKIDFCIGYPSKALGSIAGAVPVSISGEAWSTVKRRRRPIPGHTLNLRVWRHFIDKWARLGHPYPSTMPVSVIVALGKAAELALSEGLAKRFARHARAARALRAGARVLGLKLFPNENSASDTVNVFRVKPGLDKKLRSTLAEKFNIMIAGGLPRLEGKVIRIGTMGFTATFECVTRVVTALSFATAEINRTKPSQAALAATIEAFKN